MKKFINFLSLVTVVSVLSGCSSIVSKSDYAVAISSSPESANFTVTDKQGRQIHSGLTPETITLSSSSGYFSAASYTIKFTKEGYPDKVFTLRSDLDGWYIGNIVFGGLIGMLVVDPATGAMYRLPERIDVSLGRSISSYIPEKLTIAAIDDLSEDQRSRLVLIEEDL
jgi:uncharacterized protein YceK